MWYRRAMEVDVRRNADGDAEVRLNRDRLRIRCAVCLNNIGRYEDAWEAVSDITVDRKDMLGLQCRVEALLGLDRPFEALADAVSLVRWFPRSSRATHGLPGQCYLGIGRARDARLEFDAAVRFDEGQPRWFPFVAVAREADGDLPGAIRLWRRLLWMRYMPGEARANIERLTSREG
jgi:hypothetical protein